MDAVCLDASLETLRLLCCRRTNRSQWVFRRCFHEGSLQAFQAIRHAMPSKITHSLLSIGMRSRLSEGQFSAVMKPRRFLRSCLGLVGRSWILLEDPFLAIEEVVFRLRAGRFRILIRKGIRFSLIQNVQTPALGANKLAKEAGVWS
jgi:hypothetical protein